MKRIKEILYKILIYDWKAKLISFLFALMLWGLLTVQQGAEYSVSIPITFKNIPKNYAIRLESSNQTVDITVRGTKSAILGLSDKDFFLTVDLQDAKAGINFIDITNDMIALKRSLNIVKIYPQTIKIVLDKIIEKSIKVKTNFIGDLPKDYRIKDIIVEPAFVNIKGPVELIENLEQIKTADININKTQSFEAMTTLKYNKSILEDLNKNIKVKVKVIIEEEKAEKIFNNIKIKLIDVPEYKKIVAKPNEISVKIIGPSKILNTLDISQIQAIIKYEEGVLGGKKPQVILPSEQLTVIDVQPPFVIISEE